MKNKKEQLNVVSTICDWYHLGMGSYVLSENHKPFAYEKQKSKADFKRKTKIEMILRTFVLC